MSLPGGPTKDEVMAVSLAKLSLRSTDVFIDIGCGTGTVAVEAARRVGKVHAVDLREEAVASTKELARARGITNIEVSLGQGADLLNRLPHVDTAFIGGTRDLPRVLSLLSGKGVRSVVVNAVLLSTLQQAVGSMQDLGIFREVVHVAVSRSSPLAGGLMLRPLDPVFIIVGERPC